MNILNLIGLVEVLPATGELRLNRLAYLRYEV